MLKNLERDKIFSALLLTYMGIVFVGKLAMILISFAVSMGTGNPIAAETNLPALLGILISLIAAFLAGREVARRVERDFMRHVAVLAGLAALASLFIGLLVAFDIAVLFEAIAAVTGSLVGGWAATQARLEQIEIERRERGG